MTTDSETFTHSVDDGTNTTTETITYTDTVETHPDVVAAKEIAAAASDAASAEPGNETTAEQAQAAAAQVDEVKAAVAAAQPDGGVVPPVAAPEPAQPPVAPLAQEFPPSAPAEPTAPDAVTPEVAGEIDVEATEPGPELTSTIEDVSVEDAPHAAVDDSVGHAQTAAYNEAVGTDGPTGEEPVTRPDIVADDGTVLLGGEEVKQSDMPASGVWPGQEGDYAPSAEAQAQHEESASNKPTE